MGQDGIRVRVHLGLWYILGKGEVKVRVFSKESFGVGIQFLKNNLKTHIQGVFGVGNNVVKPVWQNYTF